MLATETKEQYLAAFEQSRSNPNAEDPGWLNELRQAGITSFEALGFPTTKNEEWKYTNVEPIWSQQFAHANGEAKSVNASGILSESLVRAAP